MKKTTLLIVIIFSITLLSYSQINDNSDSKSINNTEDNMTMPQKRNVIKWNLTPLIWNVKNINVSYERVTSEHGSFSLNAGYFALPTMSLADSFSVKKNNKEWGLALSGDKRYYFKNRNPFSAPNGLYWGIFGSAHYYEFESSFTVINSQVASGDLILNGNISTISAGVELGYQFVFKNNLSVDLIFIGPAISTYSGRLGISGNLKVDEDSEYIKAIYDVLVAKYPGVDKLLKEKSIKDNGSVLSLVPGMRYMIQIGYRF